MRVNKVKTLEAERTRKAFEKVSPAQIVRAVASPKVDQPLFVHQSFCAPNQNWLSNQLRIVPAYDPSAANMVLP